MNHDNDTVAALAKIAATWAVTAISSVSLQTLVQLAALIFTALQIYLLVRDRVLRRRDALDSKRGDL